MILFFISIFKNIDNVCLEVPKKVANSSIVQFKFIFKPLGVFSPAAIAADVKNSIALWEQGLNAKSNISSLSIFMFLVKEFNNKITKIRVFE